ncbi:MAG TPA: BON domain-containing protein [Noviherbaspirillum sp.]|uniref:BON domain-containing protein n=1 Tax=Noviherbaspirillum sp. TaxID=1926288 RepID=UPI002D6B5137|nr:BON domain-containing protein [Noviherbaspirillum sp.]HYD96256.1 BON domain-containing protein [Noviherbaspirillum sp.]
MQDNLGFERESPRKPTFCEGIAMKRLQFVLAVIVSTFLVACAPTSTSRSTGQTLDDAAITARVKTEIAQTQGIGNAAAINVDTYRGVVSLAGFVDSDQQRRTAGQAAQRVPGVEKVFNNLQLKTKQ